MTSRGKGMLYGALVASAILLVALVISTPNGTTLLLAIAFGAAVGLSTWFQDSRR
ncbi:MAG TPA: hypothetical protein VD789_07475 [Thermomicrobiales bacterium]|nr:hypothetical protein [Thermomicrobiales bacterium]